MGIVDEDIARVRETTDAAAVIGEHVALRRVGSRLVGLCPFHAEKSPSFSVNAAEGLWYCFGCQARGDVITFVRETQHLDFAGAVEFLASRAGVAVRYDTPGATRAHQRRDALTDALTRAIDWYHDRLLSAPDAGAARRYLRGERGYDVETVNAFRLGWAPDGWDGLCRALDLPADVMRDAGLAFRNRAGKQMDAFRGRVIFPIFEADGKPVALGARKLPGADGPKYKNSQEGPLYSKRRVLYGLNWAKDEMVRRGEVVVCEGYTDVIAFHRAGLGHAVATCGVILTDEHMAKLKSFARRLVLAYDADSAGQGAAERFYGAEQRLDLDIAVLALPPGADPAELGARDPAALRAAVGEARPFLAFRLERIRESADLTTAEGRSRYGERALAAIAEHPSDLVRDQYVMVVADWARSSSPDRLRERLGEIRAQPKPPAAGRTAPSRGPTSSDGSGPTVATDAPPARRTAASGPRVELEALRLAIHQPERVAHVLEEILFSDEAYVAAFRALLGAPTLAEAIDGADPDAAELLHRLAVEEGDADPDDVMAGLVRAAAGRRVAELVADARANQTAVNLAWPKERMELLAFGDAADRIGAASELVAWLVGAGEEDG